MPLWALILIVLLALFAVRWVMLSRHGMRNKPNFDVLMASGHHLAATRQLVDYLLENPDLSQGDRRDGLEVLDQIHDTLSGSLTRPGVTDNSRIYVRHWIAFTEFARTLYTASPFDLSIREERIRFDNFRRRDQELKDRADRLVAANPQPSFWRIFFLGNVDVRDVD